MQFNGAISDPGDAYTSLEDREIKNGAYFACEGLLRDYIANISWTIVVSKGIEVDDAMYCLYLFLKVIF